MTRELISYRSELRWAPDGRTVTKRAIGEETMPLLPARQASYENEHRIARLLATRRPPVQTPRLVRVDRSGALTFEAVNGVPLGPKVPHHLAGTDLAHALAVAAALGRFNPPHRRMYQLPVADHLQHHRAQGALTSSDIAIVEAATSNCGIQWRFAHGDLTPRNILHRRDGSIVLIDWERAGVYPAGYDLAVLWYTTDAVPGARPRIEARVPAAWQVGFWLSALLVTLLHVDRDRRRTGDNSLGQAKVKPIIAHLAVAAVEGLTDA